MNILILSWRDPKHLLAGGAEQSVWEHAKGWREAGNKITWFSSKFPGSKQKEILDGIEIVRFGHQYGGVQIAAAFYYLKNKRNIDLVVDQFHGIPFFTPLYVVKPKLAIIQEVAGKVWFLNPLPWPINWLVGVVGYFSEPFIFKLYKKVHFMTASQSARQDLERMGILAKNITVIPHGVTLPKFEVKKEKSKINTITYLGILSKDKGIEDAIECFKILSSRKDINFWVIGKGETESYEKKIKNMAKVLGEKIKFWGYVSNAKKFELLAKSHLLINPSVHEGWGLVNIEANAVGAPVVAYGSAGLVDSVKNGVSGLVLGQNTSQEMAKQARTLLENDWEYQKLSQGALSWSHNFSWGKSKKASLELINKI